VAGGLKSSGVFVVGMHRSGTSATTRVINLLGIPTCLPSDLIASRGGNERGHWESSSLVHFNDALLGRVGSAWWCPPTQERLHCALASSPDVNEARTLFRTLHPTQEWVWKDPRLCVLLPWWRKAITDPAVAILVIRSPAEIARSLLARNRIDLTWGLSLWERYTHSALAVLRGLPVCVIRFADLLARPSETSGELARFLGSFGFSLPAGADDVIDSFLDSRLRHQREHDAEAEAMLNPEQRALARMADGMTGVHESFAPDEVPPESTRTREILSWHAGRWHELHRARILKSQGLQPIWAAPVADDHAAGAPTDPSRAETALAPYRKKPMTETTNLTDGWRRWLARNKLLRVREDHLTSTLVDRAGISATQAADELADLMADPRYLAADELAQQLRKVQSWLDIRQELADLVPSGGEPERRRGVRRGEFLARYYATNTPVVLTDLTAGWEAPRRWSLDHLRSILGEEQAEVMTGRDSDPRYEQNSEHHRSTMRFADYLEHLALHERSNDMYLVANNHLLELTAAKELWNDFDCPAEFFDSDDTAGKVFLWLGPAGTVTPLHHDVMNILLVQIVGRKRAILVDPARTHCVYNDLSVYSQVDAADPDYTRHPAFRHARPVSVLLEPGDALFIPVGWWHHVEALDRSISLSFTNFRWPNQYQWVHPEGR
jgi:hypothetical protein